MPIGSAWIVNWESTGDDDRREIAIIPGDASPESIFTVRQFVKYTYMAEKADTRERFDLASGRELPAFSVMQSRNTQGETTLTCGHDRFVAAVLRSNISLGEGDSLVW